jgi:protein-S-isoprenylcysteine O-methyltransferase Ste14
MNSTCSDAGITTMPLVFDGGGKMATTVHGLELKVPPVIVVALAAALMWATARATPQLMVIYSGSLALASLVAALGIAATAAGVLAFKRANTTVNPHHPTNSTFVVTTGIYRLTRNPMYLGMLLVLLAWLLYLSNIAAATFPLLFVAYITRYQIQPEERVLIGKFGAPYEAYLRSVRRWV